MILQIGKNEFSSEPKRRTKDLYKGVVDKLFVASQRIARSPVKMLDQLIINKKWLSIITPLEDSLTITYSEVRYQNLGYQNHDDFYAGISKFNNSVVGWHGHTMEGGTIAETEGSFVQS